MMKLVFTLMPIGALSDYLFNSAIYLHHLRTLALGMADQFAGQFLPV